MSSMKTLGLAIGIAFTVSSFAFAQQSNPATNQQGNPATNQQGNTPAANTPASGGSTTNQMSQKTGGAANSQKVAHNENGNKGNHRRGRRLFSYYRVVPCHVVHHPATGRLVRICH